jgi:hypothetical protein
VKPRFLTKKGHQNRGFRALGTTDLSEKTSRTLNKINADIPELGLALRNYLVGLEKEDWDTGVLGVRASRSELCKQHWKNHITTLVIRYAEEILELPASHFFENVSGNFSNGDHLSLVFRIFADIDSDHCSYFSNEDFNMVCYHDSYMEETDTTDGEKIKTQRKFIKNILMRLSAEDIGKDFFFLDIRGL